MEETTGQVTNGLAPTLSRLRELHAEGKFCDVQLQINSEIFKTQRSLLAGMSEYFETMFTSDFVESNTSDDQPINLHEMDETAFREILHFMYTGDVRVTDFNVYQLIFMSDFLRLRSACVEGQCVRHVRSRCQDHEPMPNAIELFSFACIKAKDTLLIDTLSAHVYQHLRHYSEDAKFMKIPFESLNMLLKCSKDYILSLPGTENVILKIILSWVDHSRNERSNHRDELMKNINSSHISADFGLLLIKEFEKFTDKVTVITGSTMSFADFHLGLEKCKVEMETDLHSINTGEVLSKRTITLEVKNVSQMENNKFIFSEPYVISNLIWKIKIKRADAYLAFFLECQCPLNISKWSCCAKADLMIVSQVEEETDGVRKFNERIFSPNLSDWGFKNFLGWDYLIDPKEGFIKEDSVTFQAAVCADVPLKDTFPKKD